jgi:hypothetical protein
MLLIHLGLRFLQHFSISPQLQTTKIIRYRLHQLEINIFEIVFSGFADLIGLDIPEDTNLIFC